MQQRTLLLFLLALAFGGLAAYVAYDRSSKSAAAAAAATRLVVVAAFDIDYGVKIDPKMIRQVPWPSGSIPEGAMLAPEDAIGKVATALIAKDEPVTTRRAAVSLAGSSLASLIEPGMRALTVRVDDVIGVAGFLLPGNHVDLIGTDRRNNSAGSRTVLENLKVLAVDQQARAKKEDPIVVRAVTIEVTPQEAELVVETTNSGPIQLVLRNPLDEVATLQNTPEPAAAPAPAPSPKRKALRTPPKPAADPAAPPQTVTVIRGVDPEKVPVKY